MFAKIDVLVTTHENAVIVPRDALVKYDNNYLAYVVEKKDNTLIAVKRDVKVGIFDDDKVEILSGLKAGERLISKGTEFVREGAPVSID